ncbi:hypothetical protein SPFM7_00197 [Salmonella phage SPFM7]|nr:hypothetical protein SPFM7_00197 [Salmonella phage SPFM7]
MCWNSLLPPKVKVPKAKAGKQKGHSIDAVAVGNIFVRVNLLNLQAVTKLYANHTRCDLSVLDEIIVKSYVGVEAKGTDKSHMQMLRRTLWDVFPEKYLHGFNPTPFMRRAKLSAYESGVELQLLEERFREFLKLARPTFVATEPTHNGSFGECVGKRDARLVEWEFGQPQGEVVWAGTAHVADMVRIAAVDPGTAHLGMAVIDTVVLRDS